MVQRDIREYDANRKDEGRRSYRDRAVSKPRLAKLVAQTKHDLCAWLSAFMPTTFYLPWSADHGRVIAKLETAILSGGLFAEAMPRGSGKTSIAEGAVLWAILNGHCRYVPIIGSDKGAAQDILASIQIELETNDKLCKAYPAPCELVRDIEGRALRCAGQTVNGKRTRIELRRDILVLPSVPGSASSGAIVKVFGLTGRLRGLKHKLEDGTVVRPDFILLDDPQTDESAKSAQQCDDREKLIKGAILGMGGPDGRVSAVMPCTVIGKDDLADRMLNIKDHPEWHGERTKLIYKWPKAQKTLWTEYAELYKDGMRRGDEGKGATEFYKQHREEMDEGAKVAWDQRKSEDELSALQHAENLLLRVGKRVFMAEYQNSPEEAKPALYKLTPEMVAGSTNQVNEFNMPAPAAFLVGFVDINPTVGLHWIVLWSDLTLMGGAAGYGKYPPAEGDALWSADAPGKQSEPQAIFSGLSALTKQLTEDMTFLHDGAARQLDVLMIDCGYQMQTVFDFCRHTKSTVPLVPSRGWSGQRYRVTNAKKIGNNWQIREFKGKGNVIVHNADYWRIHAQRAFLLPAGAPGSLSLYGDTGGVHRKIAEHMCSETLVEFVRGDLYDHYTWHMHGANDLLDCMVGCCVAASYCGAKVAGEGEDQRPKRKKRRMKARVAYV